MEMPPIVEKMADLNVWLLQRVGKFPRDFRDLLGGKVLDKSLAIQDGLVAAAQTPRGASKTETLMTVSLQIDQLRYLLRFACASRCLAKGAWRYAVKCLDEVGSMTGEALAKPLPKSAFGVHRQAFCKVN
jgi:hypothetical protein